VTRKDLTVNQNTAHALLLAGLATFLVALGAEVTTAHAWSEILEPKFVGKILMELGGVGTAVWGALNKTAKP
jgi:hypothetical protein